MVLAGFDRGVLPPELAPPKEVACRFEESVQVHDGLSLCLSPEGEGAFTVRDGTLEALSIPVGEASAAYVELRAGRIQLAGWVDHAAIPLHPQTPFVAAQSLAPFPTARLGWATAAPQRLVVTLPLDKRLRILRGDATAARACSDVGLTPGDFRSLRVISSPSPK